MNWLTEYFRNQKNQQKDKPWQTSDKILYPVKDENGDIIFRLGKAKHAAVQE